MVRFYVDMSRSGSQSQDKTTLFNEMVSRIRKIIMPYQIDFELCDWWSSYRIKQQLATRFVDPTCSVFLVGDAIHTHSPKAGQGMNASIQDAWNLGWKLAACTKGQGYPALLTSYETERRPVAQRLLSFDKKVLGCFRSFCKESNEVKKEKDLEETIKEEHSSASGIEVVYRDLRFKSILEAPEAAPGIRLGYRIGDFNVVRHADGYVHPLHHVLPANGKWCAIVFPGDIVQEKQKRQLHHVGMALSTDDPNGPPCLPNCLTMDIMAQCEAILIHASSRENVGLMDLPVAFRPWSESLGWDYDKVFADDSGICDPDLYFPVYENLGISKTEGCLVVVRPDQHVSFVGRLDTLLQESDFLDTCH